MMWTSTAKVNECASVKLLGSGSGGTWSSSCLAAGYNRVGVVMMLLALCRESE